MVCNKTLAQYPRGVLYFSSPKMSGRPCMRREVSVEHINTRRDGLGVNCATPLFIIRVKLGIHDSVNSLPLCHVKDAVKRIVCKLICMHQVKI